MVNFKELKEKINEAEGVLNKLAKKNTLIKPTPLIKSHTLSGMSEGKLFLKCEVFQRTGSFKIRGAYYKLHKLSKLNKVTEVVAASAGNHAQGVAFAAKQLGLRATIFVPKDAPSFKLKAIRDYGANVKEAKSLKEAMESAKDYAKKPGYSFIHPFDDLDIIAGQGTIGLEIHDELSRQLGKGNLKDEDFTVVVPVGGGGLISGIAFSLKEILGCKKAKIVGVQSLAAPSMIKAFSAKKVVALSDKEFRDTIADGIHVREVGKNNLEIRTKYVDEVVTVDDMEIAKAIYLLLVRKKIIAEGAGAASLAAIIQGKLEKYVKDKNVVAVISGGNIDLSLLSSTILQQHARAEFIFRLEGKLADKPGSLAEVCTIIKEKNGNIISIFEDRVRGDLTPGRVFVSICVEVLGIKEARDTREQILNALGDTGHDFKVLEIFGASVQR